MHHDVITVFPVHWFWTKQQVYTYNLIISHPILKRLNVIDHTLKEMNPRHGDDVITAFPAHWFWTKTASFHLWYDHFSSDLDETYLDWSYINRDEPHDRLFIYLFRALAIKNRKNNNKITSMQEIIQDNKQSKIVLGIFRNGRNNVL